MDQMPMTIILKLNNWILHETRKYGGPIFWFVVRRMVHILICSETTISRNPKYEVLGITNDFLYPSNYETYKKEPRYNDTLL